MIAAAGPRRPEWLAFSNSEVLQGLQNASPVPAISCSLHFLLLQQHKEPHKLSNATPINSSNRSAAPRTSYGGTQHITTLFTSSTACGDTKHRLWLEHPRFGLPGSTLSAALPQIHLKPSSVPHRSASQSPEVKEQKPNPGGDGTMDPSISAPVLAACHVTGATAASEPGK